MTRLAALALAAALLVACDATPTLPAPSWQPLPTPAPMAMPAERVVQAEATLAAAGAVATGAQQNAAVATAGAMSTEWAYNLAARATYDALEVQRQRLAITATVQAASAQAEAAHAATVYAERTETARIAAGVAVDTATARAAGTAAHIEATRAAIDADDRQAKVTAGGLALGGIGLGVLVSCLILPVAAYYVALALAEWIKARARQDSFIETVQGEPLYWDATGRLVPVALIEAPAPEPEPAPATPAYTVVGRTYGRVTATYPPIAPPATDTDRELVLRLLDAAIRLVGGASRVLPGWRDLGWSPDTWQRARNLLGSYVVTEKFKPTRLTRYDCLRTLQREVMAGAHLATSTGRGAREAQGESV